MREGPSTAPGPGAVLNRDFREGARSARDAADEHETAHTAKSPPLGPTNLHERTCTDAAAATRVARKERCGGVSRASLQRDRATAHPLGRGPNKCAGLRWDVVPTKALSPRPEAGHPVQPPSQLIRRPCLPTELQGGAHALHDEVPQASQGKTGKKPDMECMAISYTTMPANSNAERSSVWDSSVIEEKSLPGAK